MRIGLSKKSMTRSFILLETFLLFLLPFSFITIYMHFSYVMFSLWEFSGDSHREKLQPFYRISFRQACIRSGCASWYFGTLLWCCYRKLQWILLLLLRVSNFVFSFTWQGVSGRVPANSSLLFEVDVLRVSTRFSVIQDLSGLTAASSRWISLWNPYNWRCCPVI